MLTCDGSFIPLSVVSWLTEHDYFKAASCAGQNYSLLAVSSGWFLHNYSMVTPLLLHCNQSSVFMFVSSTRRQFLQTGPNANGILSTKPHLYGILPPIETSTYGVHWWIWNKWVDIFQPDCQCLLWPSAIYIYFSFCFRLYTSSWFNQTTSLFTNLVRDSLKMF